MPTSSSPVSLRIDGDDRKALDRLTPGSTTTAVLLEGLRMLDHAKAQPDAPRYPRLVDDEDVQLVVEEAVQAAVAVLDRLFPSVPPESRGISTNFQGVLVAHVNAMLTGRAGASWGHRVGMQALLGQSDYLGCVRAARAREGYCLAAMPSTHGEKPLFFNSDRKAFVQLEKVTAGSLFTNEDTAVKEAFTWMQDNEISPRDMQLKLCLLSWDCDEGLLVAEIAA